MRHSGKYQIDRGVLLQKAYFLLCFFFANKEISRRTDSNIPDEPLSVLEARFFESEASRALIELAVGLRVIDDQMRQLPVKDETRKRYERRRKVVNYYDCDLFPQKHLGFREICNKIIHSDVMEPHLSEGSEPHERDSAHLFGDEGKSINWTHINGYVGLSGRHGKEEWNVLLDIEIFIKAV